jgi:hypothetical protein
LPYHTHDKTTWNQSQTRHWNLGCYYLKVENH